MNLPKPLPTFQIEQIDIIGPFRRAKHNRNISLPDLKDQNPSKSQTKRGYQHNLKYNKWYIKPQQRLKQNYHNRHQSSYTQFKEDFVYQNLYHTQEHTKRQGVQNSTMRLRSSCIDQLCADSGNLKILNKYKNKKQTVSKRVPGVVHFLLRFNKNKENERKEGHLKRKKIAV